MITKEWLEEQDACSEGVEWFTAQTETDGVKLVEKLMTEDRFNWANWLIVRIMTRPQYLAYAIFTAESVLGIYEAEYPDDNRPRKAIEMAKLVLENDSAENRAAAEAAGAAAEAAGAAWAATRAAAWAAEGAAGAAWAAAWAAEGAAGDTENMKDKIINYGLKECLKGET